MFQIKSVTLTNFRSFRGTHTWVLPESAGLYFLTGRNDENQRLGRNGCGKTTLLDAICWCLFGRTTGGLRAGDVVSRGCDGICSVGVDLVVGNDHLCIIATHNPNSLAVNGQTVDRGTLSKLLRLNYESFCYSVILPQGGDAFFDLTPTAKLNLFSQIMELDYWLELSDKAKSRSDFIIIDIASLKFERAQLEGEYNATKRTIVELEIKAAEWSSDMAKQLSQAEIKRAECISSLSKVNTTIQRYSKELGILAKHLASYDEVVSGFDRDKSELDKVHAVVESNIKRLKTEMDKIPSIGTKCPTCQQVVSEAHKIKEVGMIGGEMVGLQSERRQLIEGKASILAQRDVAVEEGLSVEKKHNQLKTKLNQMQYQVVQTELEVAQFDRQINQIINQKNDHLVMLEAKVKQLEKLEGDLGSLEAQVDDLNAEYEAVHYWVAGFKRLRLYIVEETLRSLEIEVNNNLAALGLAEWRVEFDIERENKSGSISKGFTVRVMCPECPDGSNPKLECFSGGEKQLLRLAGALGLANLIFTRAGLVNTIEFCDEPSQHLSKEAVLSLTELLHQRAISTGRRIYLIDHTAIEFGDFQGVITVVKDGNGSRILEGNHIG